MRSGQHKAGRCVVIELRARPLNRCVTGRACLRKTRGDVIRITGGGEIGGMTGDASLRRSGKPVVHMAGCAGYGRMGARQREWCAGVIELCTLPLRRRMAGRAILGKSCRLMIDRFGRLIILQVT
jgi:hypothetical protein